MDPKTDITSELKDLGSSLTGLSAGTGYAVPANYFETLADDILARVKAMDATSATEEISILSPLLSQISRQTPYTIPEGYFQSMDPSFVFATDETVGELETLSPLLGGLKKEMPYSVPSGYFDSLETKTESAKTETKVIPMKRRSLIRVAIAAAVLSFVATIAFNIYTKNNQSIDPEKKSYAWVEKNMKKVSTEDIDDFIDLAEDESVANAGNTVEVRSLLQDVSEKEIQEFLNETGISSSDTEDDIILN